MANGRNGTSTEVFRRLNTAEQGISHLKEQLAGISTQMKHQDEMLGSIQSSMVAISNTVQARGATDWKSLAAWAAVIVSLVIFYTNLTASPLRDQQSKNTEEISRQWARIDTLTADAASRAESRGRYYQKVDDLERDLIWLRDHNEIKPVDGLGD